VADAFAGTAALTRLALRRDRLLLPAWIVGFAAMLGISAGATVGLYPDEAQRVAAAEAVNATTALVALYGPIYDPTSLGALSLFKLTAFGAAITAVLMVFVVVRHTRAEEEADRLELIGSSPVSRLAPLAAALIVGCGASLTLGLVSTAALIGAGLPAVGSLAFGMGWAFTGIAFSALAGLLAQVTTNARAARGLGLIAIAVAYALRAVADVAAGGGGLSWMSPIGWMQQVRAYAGDRWWVLLLPTAMAAVCIPLAFFLRSRRDLGAGLVQDRPGPAHGRMTSVLDLAWRLQRGTLIGWLVGFAFFGFLLGSLADSLTGFLDSPQAADFIRRLGGADALTDAFLGAEMSIAGIIVAAYGIEAAGRLRSEEIDGHAELVLAGPVARLRWALSHLAVVLLGLAAILTTTGLAVGLGSAVAVSDAGEIPRLLVAGLSKLPAAALMTGLAVLAFGWLPRLVPVVWGIFVAAFALAEFGPLWEAPQWLMDLSPFVHSPLLPGPDADLGGLLPLTLVAVGLFAAGLAGWRRRDLQP
jgi:ABC-2 type transport system permease protein